MKKIVLIELLSLCFAVPALAEYPAFDLENVTVTLNNGVEMPIFGIGTFALSSEQAENSVYWALRDGYHLIDTARIYGNEDGVGRGIRRAIEEGYVTREDIFVTTKMWTSDFGNGDAAIDASLERLGLDYIDLMILHHSQPSNDVDAYQAMERAVADGKLRCIGLSNSYQRRTEGDIEVKPIRGIERCPSVKKPRSLNNQAAGKSMFTSSSPHHSHTAYARSDPHYPCFR